MGNPKEPLSTYEAIAGQREEADQPPESPVELTLRQKREVLRRRRDWRRMLFRLLATGGIVYLLFGVIFGIGMVQGQSMVPALREKDLVLFFRLGRNYQIGDIILIKTQERSDYIKRIIGSSGDEVDIDERMGTVLSNGKKLEEPYVYELTYKKRGVAYPLKLKQGEYFVMGDHRENSYDSRNYGVVEEEQIDGKVIAILRIS